MSAPTLRLATTLLFLSACAPTHNAPMTRLTQVPADARFAQLRTELQGMVDAGELQSLAIGVLRDGNVVWAEALGWADREAGVAATVTTRYGIASVGKALTATAAMTLIEGGKLDLDRRVDQILGDDALHIYAGERAPTVRELLNMTSGVPHGAITYRTTAHPSERELMENRFIVVFPPGDVFHYSNFSMAVADSVIEAVSGEAFGDFLRAHVLSPLNMSDSAIGIARGLPAPAVRYDESKERVGTIEPFPRSSRQINASLADLLYFAAFHLGTPMDGQKQILSDASLDALHTERSDLPGAHIALGWGSLDLGNGHRWIVSSGNDMGVQSNITLLPHAGVGVVVLTNSSGYHVDTIAIKAADVLAPGFAEDAIAAINAFQGRSRPFEGSPQWTGDWKGFVKTADGDLPVSMIVGADGTVEIELLGQGAKPVTDAVMRDGLFTGIFQGTLPLEERPAGEHRVELGIHSSGDEIVGFALANFRTERGKFELPTFIRLQRQESAQ